MTRAGIYVRISRDSTGEGAGVARQEEDCRRLCTAKGFAVEHVFSDGSTSAYTGKKRPGYEALCAAIRDGRIDVVVAWSVDRLYRRTQDLEAYIELCEPRSVPTYTVRGGEVDLTHAAGRMTARVLGAVARHESEMKADRQRRANAQRAAAGKPHVTRRPFGYEPDGVTVRDDEADAIRWGVQEILNGGSLRSVARRWNEDGFRGPQKQRLWNGSVVRRTLETARIAGMREYRGAIVRDGDGVPVAAAWPPIVPAETWHRLQAVLRNPVRRTNEQMWSKTLLAGVAICGKCGGKVISGGTRVDSAGERTHRYRCGSIAADGVTSKSCFHREADPVDRFVVEHVLERLSQPDAVRSLTERSRRNQGSDGEALRREIERLEAIKRDFAADAGAGYISRNEFLEIVQANDAAIARLEAQMPSSTTIGPLTELISASDHREAWIALETDARRQIVRALVEVAILPPGVKERARLRLPDGNWIAHPDSVSVTWREPAS